MVTRLFAVWDLESTGFVNQGELMISIGRYSRQQGLPLDPQMIANALSVAKPTHPNKLNQPEFGIFLAQFASSAGVDLFDMTMLLMEYLADRQQPTFVNEVSPPVSSPAPSRVFERRMTVLGDGLLRLVEGLKAEELTTRRSSIL